MLTGGIRLAVNGTIYTVRVLWHPIPGSEAILSRVPECGQRPEDPIWQETIMWDLYMEHL